MATRFLVPEMIAQAGRPGEAGADNPQAAGRRQAGMGSASAALQSATMARKSPSEASSAT
jgi:hypothetical protein